MEVVASTLNVEPMKVQVTSRLAEDFKITKEQRTQLKVALEKSFGVVINDDTFSTMHNVADIISCIMIMVNESR